jgi:hypothetical protein
VLNVSRLLAGNYGCYTLGYLFSSNIIAVFIAKIKVARISNMKKLIIFICLFFICSADCLSVPYGHLKDFEEKRHLHLIDKIVNNQEITYCSYLSYHTLENIGQEQADEQINL